MHSLVQGYSVTLRGALYTKEDSHSSWLNYISAVVNTATEREFHTESDHTAEAILCNSAYVPDIS